MYKIFYSNLFFFPFLDGGSQSLEVTYMPISREMIK